MGIIDWTNKFSVGNESLDTDHKILMDLINQLHDAYAGNRELETLEIVFEVKSGRCWIIYSGVRALRSSHGDRFGPRIRGRAPL